MGTWEPGSVENVNALAWIAELANSVDDNPIIDAQNTVIDQAEKLPDTPDSAVAIVDHNLYGFTFL